MIHTISVVDFRRDRMVLQWHSLGGTWTACEVPPALVHGIALIRAAQPNICLYGEDGRLCLQVGPDPYELAADSLRITCKPQLASFGLRRRFALESSSGGVLFSISYWSGGGRDFFRWLALRAADRQWRENCGRRWSAGVPPAALRAD